MGAAGGGAAAAVALAARRAVLARFVFAPAPPSWARRAAASSSSSSSFAAAAAPPASTASSSCSPSSLALRLAERFVKACLLIYAFTHHVGFPSLVTGPSMFPALAASGEVVLAECLPGLPSRVRKGDVVICARPVDASQHIVKRVLAVAGERVAFFPPPSSASFVAAGPSASSACGGGPRAGGLLYTGGAEQQQGAPDGGGGGGGGAVAARQPPLQQQQRLTVPAGHVWVQGDNLAVSRDSREYGPVPLGTVRGRVLCTVWPRPRAVDAAGGLTGGALPPSRRR